MPAPRLLLALAGWVALTAPAAAQTFTWTKGGGTTNWNTNNNWNPNTGFPNSAAADVTFTDTGAGTVNISGSVLAHSLAFDTTGATGYTLTSGSGQTLSGVTAITIDGSGSITHTVNLANVSAGNLLAASGSSLTITNNYSSSGSNPSLVIGMSTVIGAPGGGGVVVTGSGLTTISGSFASGTNAVTGGLTKTGEGTLTLGGNGTNLQGPVTLSGGTLQLDYTANTTNKLGSGALSLAGGTLGLQGHATVAVTQNVTGGTAVNAGHTDITLATAGAGLTLALNGISCTTGGTLDVSTGTNTAVTTTAGLTNGILGGWATAVGAWATKSGSTIVPLTTTTTFGSGLNTDISGDTSTGTATTNSLRFAGEATLSLSSLSSTLTVQSGGILVTRNAGLPTITGGTLTTPGGTGELIVHLQSATKPGLIINSKLSSSVGLTKTGRNALMLGGNNVGLTGPVNVNQGGLIFTSAAAFTPSPRSTSTNAAGPPNSSNSPYRTARLPPVTPPSALVRPTVS